MVIPNVTKNKIISLVVVLVLSFVFPINVARADDTTFQVNIQEVLTVSLTPPANWATGDVDTLLRNLVVLDVTSNNNGGFTASMTSNSTTAAGAALTNELASLTNDHIDILSSDWTRSNTSTTNFWGWSINDDSQTGTYHRFALKNSATPDILVTSATAGSASKNIYFGAKANSTISSGTYTGTVIISVVSGAVTDENDDPNDNPVTPTNPSTPTNDPTNNTGGTASYSSTTGTTVYTNNYIDSNSGSHVSYSEISSGNNTTVYDSYVDPRGVTTVNEGTPLAAGLAATSVIAATTGIFLLIAAKRRKDEEEEEEY